MHETKGTLRGCTNFDWNIHNPYPLASPCTESHFRKPPAAHPCHSFSKDLSSNFTHHVHAALNVGRHFCDFPGVAFHGLCYGLPSVLGAPGVLVHQAGQLGQLVIRPQLSSVPWNLLFGTRGRRWRPITNRDVTPIGVVVRSLFIFWFLSIWKIRIS